MSDLLERVAGAPITWGVDGSPGWGYLMEPRPGPARDGRERPLGDRARSRRLPADRPRRAPGLPRAVRPRASSAGSCRPCCIARTGSRPARVRDAGRAAAGQHRLEGARAGAVVASFRLRHLGRHDRGRVDDVPRQPRGASKASSAMPASRRRSIRTGAWRSRPASTSTGCSSRRRSGCASTPATSTWPARTRSTSRGPRAAASSTSTSRTSTRPRPPRSGAARCPSASPSSTGCSCRSGRAASTSPA